MLLAAWAVVMVRAPRSLIAEASGRLHDRRREAAGITILAAVGLLQLFLVPVFDLAERTALAAAGMCCLALAYVDVRLLVIPDLYSLGLAALGLIGPLSPDLNRALIGGAVGGGLVFGVRFLWRLMAGHEGLGFGDVKLAAALGFLLGAEGVLRAICLAAVVGAAAGLAMRRRAGHAPASPELLPFGAGLGASGLGFLYWSWIR